MTKQILSPFFIQYGMQFEEIVKMLSVVIKSEKRRLGELVGKNKKLKVFRIQEQIDIKKKEYFSLIVNRKVSQGMIELCEILIKQTERTDPIDWVKISKYLSKSHVTKRR